jgi:hypothetical protein
MYAYNFIPTPSQSHQNFDFWSKLLIPSGNPDFGVELKSHVVAYVISAYVKTDLQHIHLKADAQSCNYFSENKAYL